MNDTSNARVRFGDDTTHILHFARCCGAPFLERLRGRGLWVLMTAGNYRNGYARGFRDDWDIESPEGTPRVSRSA